MKVEAAIEAAREAVKGGDTDQIRTAVDNLSQASQQLGSAIYNSQQPGADQAPPESAGAASADSAADDVVDAEFVDEEKPKA